MKLVRAAAATAAVLLLRLVEERAIFFEQNSEDEKNVKVYQNIKIRKVIWGVPGDLLVSGKRNAIPCQIDPAKRR